MPEERAGLFIVLEGIDGSGKTLHSKLLHKKLVQEGERAALTMEPSRGEVGRLIRGLIADRKKKSAMIETLLFTADRLDHLSCEIEPLLRKGTTVVCDRYYYSTLAYQGAQGVDLDLIRSLNRFARKPDLSFYLDVPPEVALARMARRRSIFESRSLLERVREIYLDLVREGDLILVDSSGLVDGVSDKILSHTLKRLRPP
ncbi:MAG: dTMP kinase [Candidatus Bathyarchaeia archaeon]